MRSVQEERKSLQSLSPQGHVWSGKKRQSKRWASHWTDEEEAVGIHWSDSLVYMWRCVVIYHFPFINNNRDDGFIRFCCCFSSVIVYLLRWLDIMKRHRLLDIALLVKGLCWTLFIPYYIEFSRTLYWSLELHFNLFPFLSISSSLLTACLTTFIFFTHHFTIESFLYSLQWCEINLSTRTSH